MKISELYSKLDIKYNRNDGEVTIEVIDELIKELEGIMELTKHTHAGCYKRAGCQLEVVEKIRENFEE